MTNNKVEARTPSGFLELLPKDQITFNWMFSQIKSVFELFGYLPIETPAVELKEVLMAKGGGETEKQVYGLLSRAGDTGMCLHFDLTVPLARYVVEHYNELTFPFRRYQMQKVWRGERAQKGRYREFYQCDIDVIGTNNPLTDAEIPSVIYQVFNRLRIPKFTIGLNNRKFISGIFEEISKEGSTKEFLSIVDKLDKIGEAKVRDQLIGLGVVATDADFIIRLLSFRGTYSELMDKFSDWKFSNQLVRDGLAELEAVYNGVLSFGVPSCYVRIDLSVARGLDYYTGTVYETLLDDFPKVGSICSGGRYDDLCKYYTDKNLPGVGISIGLSRLFSQLKEAELLPNIPTRISSALVLGLGDSTTNRCMEVANELRESGINCEVYFEIARLKKQLKYANDLGIPFVVLIGEDELSNDKVSLKKMNSELGDGQLTISIQEAIHIIKCDSVNN